MTSKFRGGPPAKTRLEVVFDVPNDVVMAAADEFATVLNETFQKLWRQRKLDGRVSLSIARAVTARMYMTLDAAEQAQAQQFSLMTVKKLNFLIVPGDALKSSIGQ